MIGRMASTDTAAPRAAVTRANPAPASRSATGPIRSAQRNQALPARNRAAPPPTATAWPPWCGCAAVPIVRAVPAASVTTPSRIGMWA